MEIERKFLVPTLPDDLDQYPATRIDQGYLAVTPEGVEVRVRRRGDQCCLTVKHGAGISRTEVEPALTAAQFDELWRLTEGWRVSKTRYELPGPGGLTIELDVYRDALAGLQTADVEFPDETAAQAFRPPEFFGREVSDDPAYRNAKMAKEGPPGKDNNGRG